MDLESNYTYKGIKFLKWFRNMKIFNKLMLTHLIIALAGAGIVAYCAVLLANVESQSTAIIIAMAGFLVVMAVIIGIAVSRSLSVPLVHLMKTAFKTSSGIIHHRKSGFEADDEIGQMFNANRAVTISLKALFADTVLVIGAAEEGKLGVRADPEKHQGVYRDIIMGINKILDIFSQNYDNMPSPVLSIDKDYNINYINKQGAELAGKTPKEIIGRKCYEVFDMDDCNSDKCACRRAMESWEIVKSETGAHPCGLDLEVEYTGAPIVRKKEIRKTEIINGDTVAVAGGEIIQSEPEVVGAFEVITDITVIKNAQQQAEQQAKKLTELLKEVSTAADQVASGAKQLAGGSQTISQGATEQASSIEELTTSITQIKDQTKQNALSADNANELSSEARKGAVQGNEHMKAMQQAMNEINEASENISKIIKVIDDIAFQTNILALNAAVEAARAGAQGKGFAVVAEEVRNLAARSARAAKETTELIEGSIKKTVMGTKIADETASALSSIVSEVENAGKLVNEIAVASNEQATAIAQVNTGIEQMSGVVQSNSATAQQAAAMAEELSAQAETLKSLVTQFSLKEIDQEADPMYTHKYKDAGNQTKISRAISTNEGDLGKY